jgi:release factor H-coupled RctB family protein
MTEAFPEVESRIEQVEIALGRAGLDTSFLRSGPSIGHGNHFVEVQRLEEVLSGSDTSSAAVLNAKHLNLVVHSGSRGLGSSILRDHVEQFGHKGLAQGTHEAQDYIRRHDAAVMFAELNRWLIAVRVLVRLGAEGTLRLDVNHNTVTPERFDDIDGWEPRR